MSGALPWIVGPGARTVDTFECEHCRRDVPSEQIVWFGKPLSSAWCRECHENYEPPDPPSEEEIAAVRQHQYGEGASHRELKGR